MIDFGVEIIASHHLVNLIDGTLNMGCSYSATTREIACGTLITGTSRHPCDELWTDLHALKEQWQRARIRSVTRIGDSLAPDLVVAAVYSGQMHARDLLAEPIENTVEKTYRFFTFPVPKPAGLRELANYTHPNQPDVRS